MPIHVIGPQLELPFKHMHLKQQTAFAIHRAW